MLIISPHVTSPNATDLHSIASMLASPRLAGKTGQELAVALWRLILDKAEGLYHYCPATERLTGHYVYDPVKLLNVFGWSICGVTANTLAVLYADAGFQGARIASVQGHEATEVYYDGAWHLLDGDLQAYHRKHPPREAEIASYADCLADPTLISDQQNPSEPYYLPDRPPERMAELYRVEPHVEAPFVDHSHTMDFALRPGEVLERSALPDGRWIWFVGYGAFKERFPSEWSLVGPRERFEPHRQPGSGRWVYEPRLTDEYLDFEAGVLEAHQVGPTARGVEPSALGEAHCDFELNSPWVFTGTPAAEDAPPPRDGCLLGVRLTLNDPQCQARILLSVDPDLPWTEVWRGEGAGPHEVKLDLTRHVVNAYRFVLRFELGSGGPGSCVLESFRVVSAIGVAPASLGRLVEGANEQTVRFGDDAGLPTRRMLVETDFGNEADVRRKAHRLVNLTFLPGTDDRVLPADASGEYEIVYRMDAPPRGRLVRLFVHSSVRGRGEGDPDAGRAAAQWAAEESGPWHDVYDQPVAVVPHRWHFGIEGQAALDEPRRTVFVRLLGSAGMKSGRIRAHYLDDRSAAAAPPLTVTHEWRRADGTHARHAEEVPSPRRRHTYVISCGAAPKLERIVLSAASLRRPPR